MRKMIIIITSVVISACLSSCSSVKQITSNAGSKAELINASAFNIEGQQIISEETLFQLSSEQQQIFLNFYRSSLAQGRGAHEIISDFLLTKLDAFNYYGDTLIAEQAMREQKGNCMSLAILTTALAKLVGVELGYREVNTLPVFEKHGNLLLSSTHVQTKLFDKNSTGSGISQIISRPGIVIDYFPNASNIKSRYLEHASFVAMFYRNKASDALIENDMNLAFANAIKAYEYDPYNLQVYNLLAVLHRRVGDEASAEALYLEARRIDKNNLSLLNNYAVLLNGQQRTAEANSLMAELNKLEDPNPYSWLEQAYMAVRAGNYRRAIVYFKKTVELAPYVTKAYLGLYQAYVASNQMTLANNTLQQGLEWTYDDSERQQLKYKLYGRNGALSAFEIEE